VQPIVLTEETRQPGDKFLVAIRIQAAERKNSYQDQCSRLRITSPANAADRDFRQEDFGGCKQCAAFPEGGKGSRSDLEAAAKSVDLGTSVRPSCVRRVLRKAQSKLQTADAVAERVQD